MPLVQINEEDDVVSETAQTVHRRHLDDEGEEVINERVDELQWAIVHTQST